MLLNVVEQMGNSLKGLWTQLFPVVWWPLIDPHRCAAIHKLDASQDIFCGYDIHIITYSAASDDQLSQFFPHLCGHFLAQFLGPYAAPFSEEDIPHIMRVAIIFALSLHVRG